MLFDLAEESEQRWSDSRLTSRSMASTRGIRKIYEKIIHNSSTKVPIIRAGLLADDILRRTPVIRRDAFAIVVCYAAGQDDVAREAFYFAI